MAMVQMSYEYASGFSWNYNHDKKQTEKYWLTQYQTEKF